MHLRLQEFGRAVAVAAVILVGVRMAHAADMKPDDVIAKHLDSIGTAQARAAAKSRVAQGTAEYKILVGGSGLLDGTSVLVSDGHKVQLMMKFPNNLYRGEQFIFDGSKVQITGTTAEQKRSAFAEFVRVQDAIIREGLLGGTLSTAWPLLDVQDHNAKISYEGLKTVSGQKLHNLRYKPKKGGGDMEINLYFEPDTFRHVLTVYSITTHGGIGHIDEQISNAQAVGGDAGPPPISTGGVVGESSETRNARQTETRYRLEEKFSDFEALNGLNLPTHYTIHFTEELSNGHTSVSEWSVVTSNVMNGEGLDPRNFQIK